MLREYSGTARETTLDGAILAADMSIAVSDGTGYPTGATGPFVITIEQGQTAEEKVLCTSRSGDTITVALRGWDDTTASDHANGSSVAHTWSATDAREANEHVNDDTGDPHPQYATSDFSGAHVFKSADQTLASGANDTLTFDSEVDDVGGYHDNVTNNHRLTVPESGRYLVLAQVGFGVNTSGMRTLIVWKNGTNTRSTTSSLPVGGGFASILTASHVASCAAGDYFHVTAYQDSGSTLALKATSTWFAIVRLGD